MNLITAPLFGLVWNVNPSVIPGMNIPRWYGVMWALGIYAAYIVVNRIYKKEGMPEKAMDKTFLYIVIGAVLGARLGHCLFYQPDIYLANPIEILYIWEGGLASHGGTLGIIVAGYLLVKRVLKVEILWLMDRLTIAAAITSCFIRLGNLFNHEIVGKITESKLGFKFLRHDLSSQDVFDITKNSDIDAGYTMIANNPEFSSILAQVPLRFPAQLFEAIAYLLIFGVMLFLYWRTNAGKLRGFLLGVFFVLLFTARFLIEFIKENQEGVDQSLQGLNMGQLLSLPFIAVGFFFMLRKIKDFKLGRQADE